LQNKFLDFLKVEVSARTIYSKIVYAWGVRLFTINSLGLSKFLENGRNSNYLLETHFAELLESGLQKRSFHQAGTKLKNKMEKTKKILRAHHGELERSGKRSCGIQSQEYQELSAAAAATPLITLKSVTLFSFSHGPLNYVRGQCFQQLSCCAMVPLWAP
jgi:hypothetical protein